MQRQFDYLRLLNIINIMKEAFPEKIAEEREVNTSKHEMLRSPEDPRLSDKMRKFAERIPEDLRAEFMSFVEEQSHDEKIARTDALTGLLNRFGFLERLESEQNRHEENKYSVIVLDLDGFKAVNDTFGHDAGNKCLQLIADEVSAVMPRRSDTFARVGGDEFFILLPDTDEVGASEVAEKVFTAIDKKVTAKLQELYPGSGGISASIGVVPYEKSFAKDVKHEDVLKLADYVSYVVKAAGKRGSITLDYARKELDTDGVLWKQFMEGKSLPR